MQQSPDESHRPAGPSAMPRALPVESLTKKQIAAELERVQQRRAADAAYEAELICAMADLTPDDIDPAPDSPGGRRGSWAPDTQLPGVSEFFTAELAVVLNCGRGTAAVRARRAWTFRESLPATRAAMAAGELDDRRGNVLADVLADADPTIAWVVEARLLPEAAGLSLTRLKEQAVALLLELDADAVDRRRRVAKAAADVRTYPSCQDGMGVLNADLPAEEAAACYAMVDALATMLKADGDPRPIGELRAAVLSMLIRRPADHGLDGATITLTVTAALDALAGVSTEPGSINGLPITAGHLRELLRRAGALGLTAPDNGSLTFALTDDDGALLAVLTPAQLEKLARRGCADHADDVDCDCPVAGRPAATDAYEPTDAQQVFVKTRDRRCRFPNCGQRVGWVDLDHVIPHACGGETSCENLCCLCRSHHRLKTFAPGWRFVMDDDGTLHVTTPSGVTRTTRPPGRIEHALATAAALYIPEPPPGDPPPFRRVRAGTARAICPRYRAAVTTEGSGDPRPETDVFRVGGVSYVRIPAPDPIPMMSFYREVFGWEIRGDPRHPAFTDGTGHVIGHFMPDVTVVGEGGVLLYVYVADLDAALKRVIEHGGTIVDEPYPEGGLWVATARDPAGNFVGLWQSGPRG